jgi:hypothetical protein
MPNKYICIILLLFIFVACRPEKVTISEDFLLRINKNSVFYSKYNYFNIEDIEDDWIKKMDTLVRNSDIEFPKFKDNCTNVINLISSWADTMRDDGKKTIFPYADSLNFLLEANNLLKDDVMPMFDKVRLKYIYLNRQFILKLINKFAHAQSNFYYRSRPAKEVFLFKRTPNVDTIAVGDTLQLMYSVVPKWQDSLYVLSIRNGYNQRVSDILYGENNTFRWTFVAKKKGQNDIYFNSDRSDKYKKLDLVMFYITNKWQITVK